jgi:hypothetical protein
VRQDHIFGQITALIGWSPGGVGKGEVSGVSHVGMAVGELFPDFSDSCINCQRIRPP